jgi:hypothetical protein
MSKDNRRNNHLTEGWLDEPGNADLEKFAQRLASSLPDLPAGADERIRRRLREAELAKRPTRTTWLSIGIAVVAVAAVIVLAIGPLSHWTGGGQAPRATVEDHFTVRLHTSPETLPSEPLVATDRYQSLMEPQAVAEGSPKSGQ